MSAARWIPAPLPEAVERLLADGVPRRLAELLSRRGVGDGAEAEAFLDPSPDHLHDPARLAGLPQAVARILAARERGERVAVVGDYDVDGVSGTALLLAALRACGVAAEAILPHRLREGYGFQELHAERAAESGCRLLVTVDCGTTSIAAARKALAAGIDVVVTDHHLPGDDLPAGVILVNPRQEGCDYPCPDLSGAGLAFKLAQGLLAAVGRAAPLPALLRVACLGTIGDLVPLRGENRTIAALGLRALADTRSVGLRALIRASRLRAPFTASDVGYRLAPRLNAAGRLDDAGRALDLLLTREETTAEALAGELDGLNRDRQSAERQVVEEAREMALAAGDPAPIVVAWSAAWHRGVVGIAAGRLARELQRPTLLLALDGDEAVGSGRSIPGIELHAFLSRWRGEMLRFGGHAQAIGLSVARARLDELRTAWQAAAGEWPPERFARAYEYELDLPPAAVGQELLAELERLEPFGQGNPRPLLKVGPLRIVGALRRFGKGERQHLSALAVGEGGGRLPLVGWGWGERAGVLGETFEALGHLELDRYTGGPVLKLVDARPAAAGAGP